MLRLSPFWILFFAPLTFALGSSSCDGNGSSSRPEVDASDAGDADGSTGADGSTEDPDAGIDVADAADGEVFDAGPYPCNEVDTFGPVFPDVISRWSAQDALGGWPDSPVVFVGSSTIRRWETLAFEYTDHSPLQRGFGGAQLGEVAFYTSELVNRHNPRAIVLFAGTNDVNAGVAPSVVVDRFRCFRYRVGQELGWDRPILFVGITPTPARWNEWPNANAVNEAIAAIASKDPAVHYVDVATPFLATGSPPASSLFGADQLHLNTSGYKVWNGALRPIVESVTPATNPAKPPIPAPPAGTRVLIDVGPSNPEDGELTPSPDYLGQYWNNWHEIEGGMNILPGEQRIDLIAVDGSPTGIDLVIAGGFLCNGRSNGGLVWPDSGKLGKLAVGSATGDFFYVADADAPGALFLRGLDPEKSYTMRLFAARDDVEYRVTRYTVTGAISSSATLQTSGAGAGNAGATTNDDTVVEFTGVKPDAWGHVFVDVAIEAGNFAYLSLIELIVES
jgi:GDSL-like Lipase/Acylhydrolase family